MCDGARHEAMEVRMEGSLSTGYTGRFVFSTSAAGAAIRPKKTRENAIPTAIILDRILCLFPPSTTVATQEY